MRRSRSASVCFFCSNPAKFRADCVAPPLSEGLGWSEGPRGSLVLRCPCRRGRNAREGQDQIAVVLELARISFTVHDSNMMDYAINEASFGLTIAGCDR